MLDSDGLLEAEYIYDAYGNHKVLDSYGQENDNLKFIGNVNPFRYRSYYYDTETSLYYLNTRYYDPVTGRFISSDNLSILDETLGDINGLNLYAYCSNNPVMFIDDTGMSPKWWEWLITGVIVLAGVVACIVPGGQALGVSLLVAGGSMLASNIMSASGVDSKVATIISSGLNVVAGIVLCFTPFASIGASLIGSGIGSIAGGYINEAFGGSFVVGSIIGGIIGSIAGGQIYKSINFTKIAKQGVTIGRGAENNITNTAKLTGSTEYKPMRGYAIIKKIFGENYANKVSLAHNKEWIVNMIKRGAVIYDAGLGTETTIGLFYGMELEQLKMYWYIAIRMY